MQLSVIGPVYNEEENLEKNIKEFDAYLNKQNFDFEIIIVNDGSTDKTKEIAKKLTELLPEVKLLSKEINQGKGAAVRDGLLAGTGNFLLFLDADNATPIDTLEKTWPLLKTNDLVIGSRNYHDTIQAKEIKKQILIKRILGVSGNKLIRLFTGLKINDTQCGFKIFHKASVSSIIPKTKINRWAIDVEILTIAKNKNLKVGIAPVTWTCGPTSRVGFKGYLIALKELFIIKLNDLRGKYN